MGLNIQQTYAKIGIDRIPGKLEIQTETARLELHQKHAKVNIETELPRVLIDQYQCFAEEGLKNNYDLIKELSDRAYQQVLEYIGKTAENGDTMTKIGHKANIMIENLRNDSRTIHEFGMVTMPASRPKIEVSGGTLNIEPERNWEGVHNGVEGNYIPGSVTYNYTPAEVRTRLLQYPSVKISYTGNKVDRYI